VCGLYFDGLTAGVADANQFKRVAEQPHRELTTNPERHAVSRSGSCGTGSGGLPRSDPPDRE